MDNLAFTLGFMAGTTASGASTAGGVDGSYAGTSGGSATAYTLTPAASIAAYVDGQKFLFIAHATNTIAGATFAVSGLPALPSTMGSVAMPIGGVLINNTYWGLIESGGTAIRISPYDAVSVNGDTLNSGLTVQGGATSAFYRAESIGGRIFQMGAQDSGLFTHIGTISAHQFGLVQNNVVRIIIASTANFSIPVVLVAGTAAAGNSPLKFLAGTDLTTPEAGAMEYDGTNLHFSPSTVRKTVMLGASAALGTAPTIASGFGTTPTIPFNNGAISFEVNVGTGGIATSGVITMPAATNGWNCFCTNETSATTSYPAVTAMTTTSLTITNFSRTTGLAVAWAASEIFTCMCIPY